MSAYDPKLHEQQRELEAIKARLARQERLTGVAVIVAIILAGLALTLVSDSLWGGGWSLANLSGVIP